MAKNVRLTRILGSALLISVFFPAKSITAGSPLISVDVSLSQVATSASAVVVECTLFEGLANVSKAVAFGEALILRPDVVAADKAIEATIAE